MERRAQEAYKALLGYLARLTGGGRHLDRVAQGRGQLVEREEPNAAWCMKTAIGVWRAQAKNGLAWPMPLLAGDEVTYSLTG